MNKFLYISLFFSDWSLNRQVTEYLWITSLTKRILIRWISLLNK